MSHTAHGPVTGSLKFLADLESPLVYVPSKGGGDQTQHLGNFSAHDVQIHNARTELASTGLDREGFVLRTLNSAVTDFYDDDQLGFDLSRRGQGPAQEPDRRSARRDLR